MCDATRQSTAGVQLLDTRGLLQKSTSRQNRVVHDRGTDRARKVSLGCNNGIIIAVVLLKNSGGDHAMPNSKMCFFFRPIVRSKGCESFHALAKMPHTLNVHNSRAIIWRDAPEISPLSRKTFFSFFFWSCSISPIVCPT